MNQRPQSQVHLAVQEQESRPRHDVEYRWRSLVTAAEIAEFDSTMA